MRAQKIPKNVKISNGIKNLLNKDTLRLGILLEGPFGTGYLWHHLQCAARRRIEDVEAAYAQEAFAHLLVLALVFALVLALTVLSLVLSHSVNQVEEHIFTIPVHCS